MTTAQLTNIEAARVVDTRAMSCPGPLLETLKCIATVEVGEVLEIWSCDTSTKVDMPRWCGNAGHEFLDALQGDGYERLFIRRLK
jgi:tRNA 2-thiouridine synthesizing protein A